MAEGVALAVVSVLALVAVAGVVFTLATDDRDPSIVLAWLFLILIVPLLGVVAYFFVGRNHRSTRTTKDETAPPRGPRHVGAQPRRHVRAHPGLRRGRGQGAR